jgi:hypothetical protein
MKRKNKHSPFDKDLVSRYGKIKEIRPRGILINKRCKCRCGEFIIYSFNRIKRGQPPPSYIWGHFGRISLYKYRFRKGNVPWDQGGHHAQKTKDKISRSRKGRHIPGMFETGHTRTQGKKHPRYGKFGKDSPNYGKKYKKHASNT